MIATYPAFKPVVEAGRPRVYVHARPERAGVLMQVPLFETLDETARAALLHLGWRAATRELRSLRLDGARQVALGLRGAGPYTAVTWGDLNDQEPRKSDTGTAVDTAPIAAFFVDARLPAPVVAPLPGTVGSRLLDQRRSGPLRSTAEWKAYAGPNPGDNAARQRSEAIRRYLTAEDVEDLLRASETDAMPATEMSATLSLLTQLALGYDARISPEQESRLGSPCGPGAWSRPRRAMPPARMPSGRRGRSWIDHSSRARSSAGWRRPDEGTATSGCC